MALSIFDNKAKIPDKKMLAKALADKYDMWESIIEYVHQEYPDTIEEWNFAGKDYGWSLRLKDKKRVIIYLIPGKETFKTAFVFGEKAVKEALGSNVSHEIKNIIYSAKTFAEGRGFRLDITSIDMEPDIKELITIKLRN